MKILAFALAALLLPAPSAATDRNVAAIAEWAGAIQQRVASNWQRPAGAHQSSPCHIYLTISPTGMVEAAQIKRTCGDAELEQSILAAVQSSSPLPLPRDPAVFQRRMVFSFKAR
jgi:colicin import membrane protein